MYICYNIYKLKRGENFMNKLPKGAYGEVSGKITFHISQISPEPVEM